MLCMTTWAPFTQAWGHHLSAAQTVRRGTIWSCITTQRGRASRTLSSASSRLWLSRSTAQRSRWRWGTACVTLSLSLSLSPFRFVAPMSIGLVRMAVLCRVVEPHRGLIWNWPWMVALTQNIVFLDAGIRPACTFCVCVIFWWSGGEQAHANQLEKWN